MTTLIVGCGYVGTALAERLVSRGEHVVAITRSARALPEGVAPLLATLPDPALRLPPDVRRVAYAVAPDERSDEAYRRAYPEGLRSVIDALDRAGAPLERLVLVSSTAVYAEDAGRLVDASTPRATGTPERILDAERLVTALPGGRGAVARLSGIYGPGRDRIVRAVRDGRTTGDASRVGNRVHRDDAAAAIEHLLFCDGPLAPIYDVTDDASVPMGEIFAWLAAQLDVTLAPSEVAVGETLTGKRLDNAPLRATGFSFRYPTYREGYGALLAGG